jgi:fumarate reductase flavoprotein subunit
MAEEKKMETDVVICGCGFSGLAGSLAACDGGARVIIFEKGSILGGTSLFVEGMFGVESPMQLKRNIGITPEEAFLKHMDYSHWRANARLVRAFIDKSTTNVAWLQQLGVEFDELAAILPASPQTWHLFKGKNMKSRGADVINILVAKAQEKGVHIYSDTPAKELIMNDKNHIRGVIARDKNGTIIQAFAKAVIIASGDFANNRRMLEEHTPYGNAITLLKTNMTGDGIKMAWAAGAAHEGAAVILGSARVKGSHPFSDFGAIAREPYLWVNQYGERFCAEDIRYPAINALANQPNGIMYVIFDEDTKNGLMKSGIQFGLGQAVPPHTKLSNLDADIENASKDGNAFVGNTLEELGEKMGVNVNTFKATTDEYNRCCEQHYDYVFFKNAEYLKPVKKTKFYGIKTYCAILATLGGIKINHETQVLDTSNQVISGLYAVGNCAGGLYGDTYDIYNTTGGASAFAINSGRIAGENAARYALGK